MKSLLLCCMVVFSTVSAFCAEPGGAGGIVRAQPPMQERPEVVAQLAESGNADAQFDLGWLAATRGDWGAAANWFQKSADNGNTNAMFNLSMLVAIGEPKLSFEYALKAAKSGNKLAMHEVGSRLMNGIKGAVQDKQEGMGWLVRAAESGNALAQYELGMTYFFGDGITRNLIEAHCWMTISVECGLDTYNRTRAEVEKQMTREQIAEATKLAKERFAKIKKE